MSLKFKKCKEDFVCERCGRVVRGNGYTNHCPYCLWSKHVDINPGDRASLCGGLMEPIKVEVKGNEFIIAHKCKRCGYEKRNKTVVMDKIEILLQNGYRVKK